MLNLGDTGPHSPEQPFGGNGGADGRGERRRRQLLKVMNRRNRPVAAGRAREKRTFADFAARPLAVIDGVTRLRSFRDEGVR